MNEKMIFAGLGFTAGVLSMAAYHFKVVLDWKKLNDKHHLATQENLKETIAIFEEEAAKTNVTPERLEYLQVTIAGLKEALD